MSDMDIVGLAEEEEDDMVNDRPSINNSQNYGNKQEHAMNGGRLRNIAELPQRKMVDITRDKPIKVTIRVVVPVRDHPKFNFVGKLLGPKGNSLKRLQEDTMTKMAILGRGSMRDRHKEEELRNSGDPKFSHLSDELHVEVTAFAPPAEAHARIAYALAEVRRFLVPCGLALLGIDSSAKERKLRYMKLLPILQQVVQNARDYNDEIRQEQMWEMQILNTGKTDVQSDGSETVGDSTGSSQGSMSPQEQSTSPPPTGQQHPALRGVSKPQTNSAGGVTSTGGRKRPLLPGGGTRVAMSPTKRTVLSILARARAAQAKELLTTPYQPLAHIASVRPLTTIPGLREETILTGANLILN